LIVFLPYVGSDDPGRLTQAGSGVELSVQGRTGARHGRTSISAAWPRPSGQTCLSRTPIPFDLYET